jgi:amino acid adenylation domain-containing protein
MVNEFTLPWSIDKRFIIDRIFSQVSAAAGRGIAIEQGPLRLSYARFGEILTERVEILSTAVTLGDLVAIERPRSIDYVVDFVAVLAAGGVPVPIDPDLPRARRDALVRRLPAPLLLRNGVLSGDPSRADPGGPGPGTARSRGDIEDGAYVFFTSGSTGTPKPVLGSARGLRSFLAWQCAEFGIGSGDRVAFLTALGFDVSLRDLLLPLWAGATLVIPEAGAAESPESTVEWLRERAITVVHAVPSVARTWLRHGNARCNSLRIVFFGGEPLTAGLLEEWFRLFPETREQVNLYGPTETTLAKFARRIPAGDVPADPVPVGFPLPGTWACLLADEDSFDVATVRRRARHARDGSRDGEETGEIVIVTPHASRGYLGEPAATTERFLDLGGGLTAYRTGDLGRRQADGALVVVGRTDDEVKIGGVRIHPAEVTTALRNLAGVRDAFVVPALISGDGSAEAGRHQLVAFVVTAGDAVGYERELRARLADVLPRAMLSARIVVVPELPVTPNGKVDRAALRALAEAGAADADRGRFVAPAGDIECWLAEVWAGLLSVGRVSATTDFFTLGGTSIFAMQLVSRILRRFGLEISVGTVFARSTVRDLAAEIAERISPGTDSGAPEIPRIDRTGGRLPMSFAQRRLYFLQALNPAGAAYNIAVAVRLRGPLDVDRLRWSLRALVARHEVLRTVCVHDGDEPELILLDQQGDLRIDLEVVDLPGGSVSEVRELFGRRSRRPFRLAEQVPVRATLARLADEDHALLFVVHHIASDEWSTRLLLREFFATYAAYPVSGNGADAPVPLQYADYAAWERARLTGDAADRALDYWRKRLAGLPSVLELPIDRPRPDVRPDRAAEAAFPLGRRLCERLRSAAREASVTPFAMLLTAFGYVLHRHCATDDVAVGSPVAVRTRPELENLLGCFINTVVFRLDFTGEPTGRELVRRTGDCVLAAVAHQDLPFERLVAELRPARDPGVGQLLQVMFNYHDAMTVEGPAAEVRAEPIVLPKPGAQFDLSCVVEDRGDTMTARLVYAADLLSPEFVTRLGEHLVESVDVLLTDLDAPVDMLPAVPPQDVETLRPSASARETADRGAGPPPAIARFEAHAAADPGRPAVRCMEDVASYGDLDRRANQLARHLAAGGIGAGDVVALLYERSVDLVVAMLAVQKTGAAYVPLDPVFPAGHVATILAESRAVVLLTHEAVDIAEIAALTDADIVVVDRIAAVLAGYPATALDRPIDPAGAVYILFTSGSTGRPKGVVVEHGNLANFLAGMLPRMALPEHLSFANVTTFAADLGLTNVYGALTSGGTLHVIPYELATDPELLAGYFRAHPVDFMKTVPSHLQAMNEAGVLNSILPTRYLALAGEAFPWDLVDSIRRARPQCEIWNHYGPTETTIDVLAYRVPDDRAEYVGATVPIGFPIAGVQAHIVDGRLRPVPVGTPGELLIGGASVARGYLSADGRAATAFVADPFSAAAGARAYRTGDRVRLLPGGAVEFLGRIDRQTKIRGYRVEPSHVEAVLRRHPAVADAAVAVREDARGHAGLVAYCVPGKQAATPIQAVRDYAKAELPPYMVPGVFVEIDRLPITPNGKLDWRALPQPAQAAGGDSTAVPPRHATDERIIEIWRNALGVLTIGIDDDFFDVGGDSLSAMRVAREIGAGLRVISLFQYPTVRRLADYLAGSRRGDGLLYRLSGPASSHARPTAAGPAAAPPEKPVATILAVPFGGGSAAGYHELAAALPARFPLYAVELPGHDFGDAEQQLEPFDVVVERVVAEARTKISGPIVVYGHCVGAALACAIAHRLDADGADVIGAVFGGAYPSPRLPGRLFSRWARIMPSDRWKADRLYTEMLRGIGGFTDAVDPAEQAFIVRALRHDSRGADDYFSRYCHDPRHERRLPALCVVGARDRLTEFYEERHREWNLLCAGTDLAVIEDAGHYFLKHQPDELADILVTWIERRRTSAPASPASADASSAEPARPVVHSSLLRFAVVSLSQLLSMTGTRISAFGLGVWVYLETGSATRFSFILICAVFPGLLALPFAGAVVDRWDRRLVMIVSDIIGVSGTGLCLLLYATGSLEIWHIYVAAGIGAVANAFQLPAYIAATTQLVPKQYLARVSGVVQALVALSQTTGPLLGAAFILYVGVGGVLAIDVATLCASMVVLAATRFPNALFRKREESVWREVAGGFRYIARRRGFVAMNAFFLGYNLLLGFVIALTPPLVLSFASAGTLSLATMLGGVGGIAGGLVMALWGGFERRATGMVGFCVLTGVGMIVVGLYPAPVYPIIGLALIGASIALLNGHWQTLIQNKVGMELQGRMITTNRMIANLTEPLGYFIAGWLADALFEPAMRAGGALGDSIGRVFGTGPGRGMALMIVVLGAVQMLVAVVGLRWRTLRYMEDALPDAIPGAIVTWNRDKLQEEADRMLAATGPATGPAAGPPVRAGLATSARHSQP